MKVSKVSGGAPADPGWPGWKDADSARVSLGPVPLDAQPTAYLKEAWKNRAYGTVAEASVAAASDGNKLYVRIEWADDATPNHEFQDAAAAILPTNGAGSLGTIGAEGKPLALWFWEHGRPGPLGLAASGPGLFEKGSSDGLAAAEALAGGRWSVVLSGPAAAAASGKLGVAVWNGSNEERAGLGSVAKDWLSLEFEGGAR